MSVVYIYMYKPRNRVECGDTEACAVISVIPSKWQNYSDSSIRSYEASSNTEINLAHSMFLT